MHWNSTLTERANFFSSRATDDPLVQIDSRSVRKHLGENTMFQILGSCVPGFYTGGENHCCCSRKVVTLRSNDHSLSVTILTAYKSKYLQPISTNHPFSPHLPTFISPHRTIPSPFFPLLQPNPTHQPCPLHPPNALSLPPPAPPPSLPTPSGRANGISCT